MRPLRGAIIRAELTFAAFYLTTELATGVSVTEFMPYTYALTSEKQHRTALQSQTLLLGTLPVILLKSRGLRLEKKQRNGGFELVEAQREKSNKALLTDATPLHWGMP